MSERTKELAAKTVKDLAKRRKKREKDFMAFQYAKSVAINNGNRYMYE